VGENVQQNSLNLNADPKDKKNPPTTTYEQLAAKLVLAWRNSPGHYANMISIDFKSTFCAINVAPNGQIYTCQLFGGSVYFDKFKEEKDSVNYRPENVRKCKPCERRPPAGYVTVNQNREIFFVYKVPSALPEFHFSQSRMRFYNLFYDGLAADIVLKSQYPCDSASYFNGKRGVRGIALPPVYRKDFGRIGLMNTQVYLGKVPDYIDEDFEVNLTVIQKKRTCSNTRYNVLFVDYKVEIPLAFPIEFNELKGQIKDTNYFSEKVIFEKGKTILPPEITEKIDILLKNDTTKMHAIRIEGYTSIEGSTELNLNLFKNRTNYISNYLISKGVDSAIIYKKSAENFADFRTDIEETRYQKWSNLNDQELKMEVNENSDSLEDILKNHRYVLVKIETILKKEFILSKDSIQVLIDASIGKNNKKEVAKYLNAQYNLVLKRKMSLEELNATKIPFDKKFLNILHDREAMNFYIDSMNPYRYTKLREKLIKLRPLDSLNKELNTSLAILDYYLFTGNKYSQQNKFFRDIETRKNIDAKTQARILLNCATSFDWGGARRKSRLFHKQAKSHIPAARLNVDKTFELATYYTYFQDYNFALSLTKGKIDETTNPLDLIFFLKLIELTELKVPRNDYLRYFKKIKKYSGDQFCTFFNSPALNFQILDDEDVKKMYCEQCAGKR
jgi:outer membrane protein OmpA-like peptidoglycan-associated protein